MKTPPRSIMMILITVAVLVLGCMVCSLIISGGRIILPRRISIHRNYVIAPETRAWVSAWEQNLSPKEFEDFVKKHPEGREFALAQFAYSGRTNDVRILIAYGADTSEEVMESLELSGASNAAELIRWVVKDMKRSSNHQGGANGSQPIRSETNATPSAADSRRSP